ncbi:hypothetical protein JXQ31_09300 [candidate division KSB1 bacterium]|nr:hypothetical protein [candidate division KSB1 bacterium]
MRICFFTILSIMWILLACNHTSEALDENATATLTIFYSNDIMGYVNPCG